MRPLEAPAGTTTRTEVAESTVMLLTVVPLKSTVVTVPRLAPESVTAAPTGPRAGDTLVIVGARTTVKVAVLVAVPDGVTTLTGPVTAEAGTVAVTWVDAIKVGTTVTDPNRTAVAPARAWPVMVMR